MQVKEGHKVIYCKYAGQKKKKKKNFMQTNNILGRVGWFFYKLEIIVNLKKRGYCSHGKRDQIWFRRQSSTWVHTVDKLAKIPFV